MKKIEKQNIEDTITKLSIKTFTYYIKKMKDGFSVAVGIQNGKATINDEAENIKHNTKQLQSILDAFAGAYGVSNVTYRWFIATQTDADNIPHIRLQIFSNANSSATKLLLS